MLAILAIGHNGVKRPVTLHEIRTEEKGMNGFVKFVNFVLVVAFVIGCFFLITKGSCEPSGRVTRTGADICA